MTENLRKEQLSLGYVRLIAALAGFSTVRPELDDDSVDLIIRSDGRFDIRSPSLEIQLKATSDQGVLKPAVLALPISRKNYDDLRRRTSVPRLLVVFLMPDERDALFDQTEEQLTLRRCAYWTSLSGLEATEHQTRTVHIPRANLLTPEALRRLMETL